MFLIALATLAIAAILYGSSHVIILMKDGARCYESGYSSASSPGNFQVYCGKLVSGTTIVVPLSEVGK